MLVSLTTGLLRTTAIAATQAHSIPRFRHAGERADVAADVISVVRRHPWAVTEGASCACRHRTRRHPRHHRARASACARSGSGHDLLVPAQDRRIAIAVLE